MQSKSADQLNTDRKLIITCGTAISTMYLTGIKKNNSLSRYSKAGAALAIKLRYLSPPQEFYSPRALRKDLKIVGRSKLKATSLKEKKIRGQYSQSHKSLFDRLT